MFGLTKHTTAPIATRTHDARVPELWVPKRLTATIAERAPLIADGLSPLTDRGWSEYLGETVQSRGGTRLSISNGTRLSRHVADFIAVTQHSGQMPQKHFPVGVPARVAVPIIGNGGTASDLRAASAQADEARKQAQMFWGDVGNVTAEILADPERAWSTFVTLRLVADAETVLADAKEAERTERQRIALLQCPVCGSDHAGLGAVRSRPWPGMSRRRNTEVRSCEACFEAHRSQHFAARSTELLESGATRADLVRAHVEGRRS